MGHISVRPASEDEFSVLDSLLNLSISNPNEGIYKISATTFGNRTFSSSGGVWGQILGSISNQTDLQTALNAKQASGNYITALTGDGTASGPGSSALTLATVNSNVGTFGSATQSTQITVNGKGLITAIANVTVTPAVGSITGLGTGVATALGVNIGSAGAFITFNGNAGTPSALVGTNISGTAASLTAGTVTTNANLTGPITSVGNATSIASQTGTGTKFVVDTSPTIVTPTISGNMTMSTSAAKILVTSLVITDASANTRGTLRVMPNGTVASVPAALQFFGTDFSADATNYEALSIFSRGSSDTSYIIRIEKGGTGTVRPLYIYTDPNTTQLVLNTSGNVGIGTATTPSLLTVAGLINMKNYTVATLPAGTRGDIAYVTDALAPGFLTVIVGGGAVVAPVFFNGANWVAM